MIVQPTPTNPAPRRLRARRVAGLIVPPVLLALVVLAGVAGARPNTRVVPQQTAPTTSTAPARGAQFPSQFGDLDAIAPSEDIDGSDLLPSDAIAVAGYLGVDPTQSGCFDVPGSPYGPWCDRRGILAEAPWSTSGTAAFPSHLRVHIPVGVRLPSRIEGAGEAGTTDPMPVLVVGRKSVRPPACQGWGPVVCDDELEVDRIAWADGLQVGLTPLIDDRLATERRPNPFVSSLDAADLPLLAALVWPEDVWRLDSRAGGIAADGTPGVPVWYLRVLDGARVGLGRSIRWELLAERDLRVLAAGRPGDATTASLDGG
jgi:hypothetical protein